MPFFGKEMEELIWCGSNRKSGRQENCCQDELKKKIRKKKPRNIYFAFDFSEMFGGQVHNNHGPACSVKLCV